MTDTATPGPDAPRRPQTRRTETGRPETRRADTGFPIRMLQTDTPRLSDWAPGSAPRAPAGRPTVIFARRTTVRAVLARAARTPGTGQPIAAAPRRAAPPPRRRTRGAGGGRMVMWCAAAGLGIPALFGAAAWAMHALGSVLDAVLAAALAAALS